MSKVRERIYVDRDRLHEIETDILNRRHIERYGMVRQWCYGVTLDAACGCGYGTYMISLNPDVDKVIGVDISEHAIAHAKEEYSTDKIEFIGTGFESLDETLGVDTIVSIETIEHLPDPSVFIEMVKRVKPKLMFISFPSKKTTHYNPHHFYDYQTEDIVEFFPDYKLTDEIELDREVKILRFEPYV